MIARSAIDRLRRVDPARLDAALAVLLAFLALLPLWLVPTSAGGRAADLLASALALAMTLPIAFRRRWPVQVLATTVIATILAALTGPSSGVGLAVLIAIYSVAVYADRRESRAALALTMIAVAVVVTLVLVSTDPALPLAILPLGVVIVWTIVGAVWLLGDLVRSRSEAVEELRQRNAELVIEREENARLAVADERARIARELHDAVAHSLSVMVVQAGAARRALETAEPDGEVAAERARGALAAIEATGRDTLSEMRRVVGALRPTGDEPYEPQPSLDGLDRLLTTVREAGLPVELVVEGEARPIPRGVDLSAYRVVQESLTNTLKHANAASARVRLRYGADALDVEVTDDGRGAAARLLETPHRGYGLAGMRERVAMVGGEIVAQPGPSGGFVVHARLPLGRSL
jgi:signal transduction histidine kinase